MRSVVVVLPASMCAMIPMLRVFSRAKALGILDFCRLGRVTPRRSAYLAAGKKRGPVGPRRVLLSPRLDGYVVEVSTVIRKARRGVRKIGRASCRERV